MFSMTTLAGLLLASSAALAATQTVVVGQNGTKTFTPNNIQASVGDIINFQFVAGNHTATQSTFAAPCTAAGFKSGFKPANATNEATFSIMVNSTDPIWVYCGQTGHCEAGMVMAPRPRALPGKSQRGGRTIETTLTGFRISGTATSSGAASGASGASGAASATASSGSTASSKASGGSSSASGSSSAASSTASSGAAMTVLSPTAGMIVFAAAVAALM
ncbi:hypothetical protein JCM24511_06986 [Saitozyma sp. JCM 24511]|nr:hypothetical protein JCM24511_06986 [Saitozyma sp. JCM 24511]